MKITIQTKQPYLLAKDTLYYYDIGGISNKLCDPFGNAIVQNNEIQKNIHPAVIRITSLNKLKSGIVRVSFIWFTDEIDSLKLVDAAKYLLICDDVIFYQLKLLNECIPKSLVSHYIIPLNDKLKSIVKKLDDFHTKMTSLRLKLAELNGEIDQHVQYHEKLRKTLPHELYETCEEAAYDHEEFISYNDEMVNFITGDTKS